MLKRVGGEINSEGAVTTIGEAEFPVPFPPGLEFNSPVHGNWNIVHTGMLMPEAIQIYVCAFISAAVSTTPRIQLSAQT